MATITLNGKKIKEKVRRSTTERIVIIAVMVVFILYSITLIYPFIWMGINSVKSPGEFYSNRFNLTSNPLFVNYWIVLNYKVNGTTNLIQMFVTSIIITVVVTVLEVFLSACTSYVVCYYKFPGRNIIYSVIIFALVVPIVGTLPAMYKFMLDTQMLNTIPGILFIYLNGFGFSFLILFGHFKSLSWSYAEAAKIDGAGHFKTFFYVMLPLSMPALTAMAVVSAIGYWNDYATPAVFLQRFPTLAVGIFTLTDELKRGNDILGIEKNNYPMTFAAILLSVAPIVIFFACFQKTIMKNMVAGGLKG